MRLRGSRNGKYTVDQGYSASEDDDDDEAQSSLGSEDEGDEEEEIVVEPRQRRPQERRQRRLRRLRTRNDDRPSSQPIRETAEDEADDLEAPFIDPEDDDDNNDDDDEYHLTEEEDEASSDSSRGSQTSETSPPPIGRAERAARRAQQKANQDAETAETDTMTTETAAHEGEPASKARRPFQSTGSPMRSFAQYYEERRRKEKEAAAKAAAAAVEAAAKAREAHREREDDDDEEEAMFHSRVLPDIPDAAFNDLLPLHREERPRPAFSLKVTERSYARATPHDTSAANREREEGEEEEDDRMDEDTPFLPPLETTFAERARSTPATLLQQATRTLQQQPLNRMTPYEQAIQARLDSPSLQHHQQLTSASTQGILAPPNQRLSPLKPIRPTVHSRKRRRDEELAALSTSAARRAERSDAIAASAIPAQVSPANVPTLSPPSTSAGPPTAAPADRTILPTAAPPVSTQLTTIQPIVTPAQLLALYQQRGTPATTSSSSPFQPYVPPRVRSAIRPRPEAGPPPPPPPTTFGHPSLHVPPTLSPIRRPVQAPIPPPPVQPPVQPNNSSSGPSSQSVPSATITAASTAASLPPVPAISPKRPGPKRGRGGRPRLQPRPTPPTVPPVPPSNATAPINSSTNVNASAAAGPPSQNQSHRPVAPAMPDVPRQDAPRVTPLHGRPLHGRPPIPYREAFFPAAAAAQRPSTLANVSSVSSRFSAGQSLPLPRLMPSPFFTIEGKPLLNVEAGVKKYTQSSYTFTANLPFHVTAGQSQQIKQHGKRVFAFSVMVQQLEDNVQLPDFDPIVWPETTILLNTQPILRPDNGNMHVDLTPHLSLRTSLSTNQDFKFVTSELDLMPYQIVAYMVTPRDNADMINEVKEKRFRTSTLIRDKLIARTQSLQDDDGVSSSSETISLLDPVSLTRITLPVRADTCVHNACFDLMIHLEYNRSRPTWKCPHCNGPAPYESLFFDGFVAEMLKSVTEEAEVQQVLLDSTHATFRAVVESELNRNYRPATDHDRSSQADRAMSIEDKGPAQPVIDVVHILSDDDD